MKNHYKYILIILILNIGCNSPKENHILQSQNNIEAVETKYIDKSDETPCLDTTKLNSLKLKYKQVSNANSIKWVITKRIDFRKSNLMSCVYYYSADSMTKCKKPIDYFYLDSLKLKLADSRYQIIKLSEFESGSSLDNLENPNSKLIDLNFDGIDDLDLGLNEVSGATNELRRYFIYNPRKAKFENGIDVSNVRVDTSQNLIYNSWNGGHAGKISKRIWSKIINYKELITVKEISSDYNQRLDSYIVETSELNDDGKYRINIDTIRRK